MKKFSILMITVLAILMFVSCSGNASTPAKDINYDDLVGNWRQKFENSDKVEISFKAAKTADVDNNGSSGEDKNGLTVSISGDTITFTDTNGATYVYQAEITSQTIDEETMFTLKMTQKGENSIFVRRSEKAFTLSKLS